MNFTAEERIFILNQLLDYEIKSALFTKDRYKVFRGYCPYCLYDNSDTKGGSFLFERCIYCQKIFKLT